MLDKHMRQVDAPYMVPPDVIYSFSAMIGEFHIGLSLHRSADILTIYRSTEQVFVNYIRCTGQPLEENIAAIVHSEEAELDGRLIKGAMNHTVNGAEIVEAVCSTMS
jgi:hypothetical protein